MKADSHLATAFAAALPMVIPDEAMSFLGKVLLAFVLAAVAELSRKLIQRLVK